MADGTNAAESVILIDNWPGIPVKSFEGGVPDDGFTGSGHHNVETAAFLVGTKAQVYNNGDTGTGVAGMSTLMYLKNSTTAIAAAYELCQPASATNVYEVSSTVSDAIIENDISPLMAVSVSAMTASYYGWFLVGGVCPGDFITAMSVGDYPTDTEAAVIIGLLTCGVGDGGGGKAVLEVLVAATALTLPTAYTLVDE